MDCSHFCCIFHRDCFQFPWNSLKVNCIIKWLLLPLLLSACQEGTQIMGKYSTIVSFQVNLCKDYTDDVEYMNTFFKCINVSVVTAGWTLSCLTIIISSHHIFFRTDHSSYILPSTLLWKLSICLKCRSVFVTFFHVSSPSSIIYQHELHVARQVLESGAAFLHSLNHSLEYWSHEAQPLFPAPG